MHATWVHGYTFRNVADAFEDAIKAGRLTDDPDSKRYAGDYMYMFTDSRGVDMFKHYETRNYLRA